MFDFAFSELLVVFVVALVVLGPTRLPGLVRKVGRWMGKARSMARDFREQLENEVNIDELNRAAKRYVDPTAPPAAPPSPSATDPQALADAPTPPADSGYPYGMPTDTASMTSSSADPAVTGQMGDPGDDTYSHAHAAGDAPAPWSPEAEHPPDPAPAADAGGGDAGAGPARETEQRSA